MTDTHFMADDAMIPPLPADPTSYAAPDLPQGNVRPPSGVPKFKLVRRRLVDSDGGVTYAHVEMVDILTPGDPKSTPCHKVTAAIKRMYPREYDAFRRNIELAPSGWPVEMWPALNEQQVMALRAVNIRTVEELAGTADANLHRIPMGKTLKNDAIAALKAKKENDSVEAMRRKDAMSQQAISTLETQLAETMRQLAEMQAKLDAKEPAPVETGTLSSETVPAPAKRGPGRPPKSV